MPDPRSDGALDATITATGASAERAPSAPAPKQVGRYELGEILGAGGMGVVHRALDPELGRVVAIKLVRARVEGSSGRARLLREAQAMARLRHPHVVPIFDVGPAEDGVFVAMPLLEGGTLKGWLAAEPRPLHAIVERYLAAGRGLVAAHAAGLVHRDFKPDNVLLGADGEVQVADFGLARVTGDASIETSASDSHGALELTRTGDIMGTPAYMAPEQLRGEPSDARADQFSFCVALWEAVYGARPFPAPGTAAALVPALLGAIAAGPTTTPPGRAPRWLRPLLERGLRVDPAARWPTLAALLDAIEARRTRRRWPWVVAATAVVAIAATALALALRPDVAVARGAAPAPVEAPPLRTTRLTNRGDVRAAALSPDGSTLALLVGDALIVRGTDLDAEERVLVSGGLVEGQVAWTPDGKQLSVNEADDSTGRPGVAIVDVETGVRVHLRGGWPLVAFPTPDTVALVMMDERDVVVRPLRAPGARAVCPLPGDYKFVVGLRAASDRSLVALVFDGDQLGSLIVLDATCHVRATYAAENVRDVAISDAGTIVALVSLGGESLLVELSLDGVELGRRRVAGGVASLVGRHGNTDYVLDSVAHAYLERLHPGAPPVRVFSSPGLAAFALAPDGETVAWIERRSLAVPRGLLRLSTLHDLVRRGRPVLSDAVTASWSPDGGSIAATVVDDAGVGVVVLTVADGATRRLPLAHVDAATPPLWLDDHRVAVQNPEHTTYEWVDLQTGVGGDLVDRAVGWVFFAARSPRDGTLAFVWNRDSEAGLWVIPPGRPPEPRPIEIDGTHWYQLAWSPKGELVVSDPRTYTISRIDLATGRATVVAQLDPNTPELVTPPMFLPDGDLLIATSDVQMDVALLGR